MGRTCSGCGSGAQQTCRFYRGVPLCGVRAGGNSLDTLLGFETTSPRRFFALLNGEPEAVIALSGVAPGVLSGCGCCRPAWWWGVVFDLWIVVASI